MANSPGLALRRLDASEAERLIPALGALLHACVLDGASIGFVLPFEKAEADAYWQQSLLAPLGSGVRVMLVAEADGTLCGTGQLNLATMPNQPHRADVMKVMVHPSVRGCGIGSAIMAGLEAEARAAGRTLLTLDTRTGDTAERLYAALGYETSGVIPDYCLNPFDGSLEPTTIMFKRLGE